MDLEKSCWGPPVVSFELLLGLGAGAALLLVGTWRRFGTAAVLAPWLVMVAGFGWALAIRIEYLRAFGGVPRLRTFAWELAPLASGGLLVTLASAALWAAAPRLPAAVHVGIAFVQFVLAYSLGFVALEMVAFSPLGGW